MIQPRIAMVLAAGRGERLRPLTDTLPKPLIRIGGKTLIDHALDRLEAAGIEQAVVNVHYLADQIVSHLAARKSPEIIISPEPGDHALETGGAIVHALKHLGTEPFYVVNSDSMWLDGRTPALRRLAAAWNAKSTDIVLLLHRMTTAVGHDGVLGDFMLDQLGLPQRRLENEVAPYVYTGVQLVSPALFRDVPERAFSFNVIWNRCIEAGRARAIVHDGEWYTASTEEGLGLVRRQLEMQRIEQ